MHNHNTKQEKNVRLKILLSTAIVSYQAFLYLCPVIKTQNYAPILHAGHHGQ